MDRETSTLFGAKVQEVDLRTQSIINAAPEPPALRDTHFSRLDAEVVRNTMLNANMPTPEKLLRDQK